jgi:hypothetical protein
MAYQKIQPKQIQLPTFYSRSGDLIFSDQTTGVVVDLSRNLSGNFNITGSLSINNGPVFKTSSTNTFNQNSGNLIFGGLNNTALSGRNNTILAGSGNNISGTSNVIVNGINNRINNTSSFNTILAGSGCSFANNITGSVILADLKSATTNNKSNSLIINFASGITFDGGPTTFETNFIVNSPNSGLFNSDLTVNGFSYFNNVRVNNDIYLSGNLIVDGQLRLTGDLSITGGSVYIDSDIKQSGSLEVNGNISATGLISGYNLESQIANINTINTADLNITNSATLTGSNIATESWINQQGYISSIDSSFEDLTVLDQLNVYGTGIFGSIEFDSISGNTGYFNNIITTTIAAEDIVFTNTLKIGVNGSYMSSLRAGKIVCPRSGSSNIYTGFIDGTLSSQILFFCLSGENQTGTRYLSSKPLLNSIAVSMVSSNFPSTITGNYLLL